AKDMLSGVFARDVLAALANVAAKFKLEIQRLAIGRPLELIVHTYYRKAVALVVDRLAVERVDDTVIGAGVHGLDGRLGIWCTYGTKTTSSGKALAQMQLEAGKIAHLRRRLDRRPKPY